MRVLVVNLADNASTNIRDRLLESDEWADTGSTFRGHAMWQRQYDIMLQVDGPTIYDEDLSGDLADTEWPIDAVWFLSRHRAASGKPSLTVHPIGNWDEAKYGGRPRTLSTAAPRDMGALLRRLAHHRDRLALPHEVTYEATHHGPFMEQPSLFVEIGSDEAWYDDRPSAEALAAAVHDVLDKEGFAPADAPIQIGLGGGHYVPQQTARGLAGEADFGHLMPQYAFASDATDDAGAAETVRRIEEAAARTPELARGDASAYMHKKGLKGPQRQIVRDWLAARAGEPETGA